jgi:hypothetical protein
MLRKSGMATGSREVVAAADSGEGLTLTDSTPSSADELDAPDADAACNASSAAVDDVEEPPPKHALGGPFNSPPTYPRFTACESATAWEPV